MHAAKGLDGAVLGPGRDLVLGRYRVVRRIGAGGYSQVFLARDEQLDREVALKVIPSEGSTSARVRREALAAARLDHPAIVRLFDADEGDGAFYLVSEFVGGQTFAECQAQDLASDRDVVFVGLAVADALAHAHERGVIHRDIKPQNIIIPFAGHPRAAYAKLTDFGVAQLVDEDNLTCSGEVIGTLTYMSPEQAAGDTGDELSDLYALALTLYEGLTGENPRRGRGPAATAKLVGTIPPFLHRVRRDLPGDLCVAIDQALSPRPEERGELADLACALSDALSDLSDVRSLLDEVPEATNPDAADPKGEKVDGPLRLLLSTVGRSRNRAVTPPLWVTRAGVAGITGLLTFGALLTPLTLFANPLTQSQGTQLGWEGLTLIPLSAAIAVGVLPRVGWLLTAAAIVVMTAIQSPGAAVLLGAALVATPLALYGQPSLWSLPVFAPALGVVSLSPAFLSFAGRAPTVLCRMGLGVVAAWWVLLSEPLLGRVLLWGQPGEQSTHSIQQSAGVAFHVLGELLTSPVMLLLPLWAVTPFLLTLLVRGGSWQKDVAATVVWTGAVVAGMLAIGHLLPHQQAAHLNAFIVGLSAAVGAALFAIYRRAR